MKLHIDLTRAGTFEALLQKLASSTDVSELKMIREEVESTRLNCDGERQIRFLAAELKLQADRRLGKLLAALVKQGGDRRSKSPRDDSSLASLGVDHHYSSRWQQVAEVPEQTFQRYLSAAKSSGCEVTFEGLMRFARRQRIDAGDGKRLEPDRAKNSQPDGAIVHQRRASATKDGREFIESVVDELINHRGLLASVLTPICLHETAEFKPSQRRVVLHLLSEMEDLLIAWRSAGTE